MTPAKQFWLLKDAIGAETTDVLEHEPTRHTISDFIHVIEHSAYLTAVKALKYYADETNWTYGDVPGHSYILDSDKGFTARKAIKELGEV